MNEISIFVSQYGGIVLFAIVFAEQIGLPIPAVPVLLAAGALAGPVKKRTPFALHGPSGDVVGW